MKTWTTTLVLVLGMTMATAAGAQPFGPGGKGRGGGEGAGFGPRHGPGPGICGILRAPDAGLSDEQRAAIQPICEAHRERARTLFEDLGALREQVEAVVEADAVDLAQVQELHARMAEVKTALVKERVETRAAVLGQLTEEQRAQAAQKRAEMKQRRGKGKRGKGAGQGRGPGIERGPGPDEAGW